MISIMLLYQVVYILLRVNNYAISVASAEAEGGQHQQRGGRNVWCSYHKTTTHSDADCRARPENRLNGNAHFAQVRRPSIPVMFRSWDLSIRDNSDEKPCISFSAREAQPATKPAEAHVEEEKGA